jgi:hypothetical protein
VLYALPQFIKPRDWREAPGEAAVAKCIELGEEQCSVPTSHLSISKKAEYEKTFWPFYPSFQETVR